MKKIPKKKALPIFVLAMCIVVILLIYSIYMNAHKTFNSSALTHQEKIVKYNNYILEQLTPYIQNLGGSNIVLNYNDNNELISADICFENNIKITQEQESEAKSLFSDLLHISYDKVFFKYK